MFLFSTVLFVDGNPVGYNVEKMENWLVLNPAENPNWEIDPPVMSAHQRDGEWHVEGTGSRDLIDQVIEDVSLNSELEESREYAIGAVQ